MKYLPFYAFLCFFVLLNTACDRKKAALNARIAALEAKVDSNKITDNNTDLVTAYNEYAQKYGGNGAAATNLLKSANLNYQMTNFQRSIGEIDIIKEKYGTSKAMPDALLLEGDIYDNFMLNDEKAAAAYRAFVDKYPDNQRTNEIKKYFSSDRERITGRIKAYEKEAFGKKTQGLNPILAAKLMAQYEKYGRTFTDDSTQSPVYLLKAGEVAQSLGMVSRAILMWGKLLQEYPKSKVVPETIFMQAMAYDVLHNTAQAQTSFKALIQRFPNHILSKNAQVALDKSGKSPEELVKQFEKQKEKQ